MKRFYNSAEARLGNVATKYPSHDLATYIAYYSFTWIGVTGQHALDNVHYKYIIGAVLDKSIATSALLLSTAILMSSYGTFAFISNNTIRLILSIVIA